MATPKRNARKEPARCEPLPEKANPLIAAWRMMAAPTLCGLMKKAPFDANRIGGA
jgi:hypothetical protein